MVSHCAEKAPTPAAAVATAAPRAANARAPGVDRNRRAAESMGDGIAQQLVPRLANYFWGLYPTNVSRGLTKYF
eukprot:scaffold18419_cov66-Phaeocystis_antarctica.AAC.3